MARPVGCKGPLIGCLVGVCSLAGGMQSERAGLAPEIRKFRPFLQKPGCRDARRVCGWTSIVVGVHVFFTHQGNQSSSQCSLALLTHASKHNAVACSQPGHGGPGSLMRARPVGEDNQSGPYFSPGLQSADNPFSTITAVVTSKEIISSVTFQSNALRKKRRNP